MQGNSLVAQRFDPGRLERQGDPISVLEEVARHSSYQERAAYWASDAGLLVYLSSGAAATRRIVWMSRDGETLGDALPAAPMVTPALSPDGTRLAWIAPRDGVLNVWVAPVGPAGVDWDAAAVVTDDTDRGIRAYLWAWDGRHLLYVQDTGGDENWRLYDVDMDTMARRDLTPFDGIQARIIATRKSHRDEVLVGINRDNPQLHDVYRLDLRIPGFRMKGDALPVTLRIGSVNSPTSGPIVPYVSVD